MRAISIRQVLLVLVFAGAMAQTNTSQPLLIEDAGFIPSGWMGDGAANVAKAKNAIQVEPLSTDDPHSSPYCQRWTYRPKLGHDGWAAVAWQYPEKNWGEKPGKDWSKRGFTRVTVWARGVKDRSGTLPKVQFKAGGNTNPDPTKYPNQASFEVEGDFVTLTEEWKQYSLDLKGQNLSRVISAFTLVLRAQDIGPDGAIFYLDDVEYDLGSAPVTKGVAPLPARTLVTLPTAIWVAYAPTHFNPNATPPLRPSEASIRTDLQVLHDAGFDGLVTYGAEFPAIPRIAESIGFKAMLLGIWEPGNVDEMRQAKESARSAIVAGVIVGNEGLTFHRYTLPVLREAMDEMRRDTGKPISTTEIIESYSAIPQLAEWSDFLAVNAHPYFHEIRNPIIAAEWTATAYAKVAKRYPDKMLIFKEVGLPTAVPGVTEKDQFEYYQALQKTPVKFVFFEAFDALFKKGSAERSWGIFHADRTPKPAAALAKAAGPSLPKPEGKP